MLRGGHLELFVSDVPAAADFYQRVLGADLVSDQGAVVWVALGDREILLRPAAADLPQAATYQEAAQALVLYTDDLEQARRDLAGRGLDFAGTDGSEKCLTFRDPDGHWFQLVNPKDH